MRLGSGRRSGSTAARRRQSDSSSVRSTRADRPGTTLVELIIVLMIASILATLAAPPITSYWNGRQIIQARDAFILTAAGARSSAAERGDLVLMNVYPDSNSVVLTDRNGTVVDVLRLQTDGTRAQMVGPELSICYLPRGYAHPGCRDGRDLPTSVGFTRGGDTLWAQITLGQVRRR